MEEKGGKSAELLCEWFERRPETRRRGEGRVIYTQRRTGHPRTHGKPSSFPSRPQTLDRPSASTPHAAKGGPWSTSRPNEPRLRSEGWVERVSESAGEERRDRVRSSINCGVLTAPGISLQAAGEGLPTSCAPEKISFYDNKGPPYSSSPTFWGALTQVHNFTQARATLIRAVRE